MKKQPGKPGEKSEPVNADSPAGENETISVAEPVQPAEPVVEMHEVEVDPFEGMLPSRSELAELQWKAAEARRKEFADKMPHILRHIASEIRQAAGRGDEIVKVDLSTWDEWVSIHKDGLADYVKKSGYRIDSMMGSTGNPSRVLTIILKADK